MSNNQIIHITLIIMVFYYLMNNKVENYADDYSVGLHADTLNRTQRHNLYHSKRTSEINGVLPVPNEYNCWYHQY
jgi:hypothetical protein